MDERIEWIAFGTVIVLICIAMAIAQIREFRRARLEHTRMLRMVANLRATARRTRQSLLDLEAVDDRGPDCG